jgi:hypothetical protein
MKLETDQDVELAVSRLAQRSPEALASFIASFACDPGPIGEQVRTFIVGDDLDATCASLTERIDALRLSRLRHIGRAEEAQIGERLELILDAIESLVLAVNSRAAFELTVRLIERDGDAMECCGDHHYFVAAAVNRAIRLAAKAGRSLPQEEVRRTLERLIAEDSFCTREALAAVAAKFASADPVLSTPP